MSDDINMKDLNINMKEIKNNNLISVELDISEDF